MLDRIPLGYYAFAGLLNFLTSFALLIFVFSKNPKSRINQAFCLFAFSVAGWGLCYFLWLTTNKSYLAEMYLRTLMVFVIFIPTSFTHFVLALLKIDHKKINLSNYLISAILAGTAYTQYFAHDLESFLVFPYWLKPGFLFYVHTVHFFACALYSHYLMLHALKLREGVYRNQILYVLMGTGIGFSGGALNYLTWSRVPIPPFLNPLVSVYVATVAYAIIRHRLMDIEVVIKKAVVFTSLLLAVFAVFVGITMTVQELIAGGRLWGLAISSVLIILILRPLEIFLVNVTDKYLFQKKYSPTKLLKTFTNDILALLDLDKLVQTTITTLVGTLNLESCAIFLLNRTEDKYELQGAHVLLQDPITLNAENHLLGYLKKAKSHLLYEESLPITIKTEMKRLSAELAIPLWHQNQMIGLMVLGRKKSGQDYTTEDIDILTALARTESVALSNARLFGEAKQNMKLAAIGALAAGINHEVCNPLNRMMSDIQIFLKSKEKGLYDDKSEKELLTMGDQIMKDSMDEIRKIASITRKLSDFSKPEKEVVQEKVDIEDSLREALVVLGHQFELKKIEFHKEIKKPLFILADKVQIQEVFFNLIRNAIQAIEQKGIITFSAREDSDKVFIDISDTGHGIPEDKLHKLYTPFYTTKTEGEGTGLGLAIVRQIVIRNKGDINVKSEVGKGTTFTLQFQKA